MKYWLMACKRTVSWSELSISGRIQFENTKMPKVLIWRLDEVTVSFIMSTVQQAHHMSVFCSLCYFCNDY